ncbi:MAG: outer membrane protein assembly factor BamE [Haliea sp.]|nr:MAG: outer membrane protein assembly factor BamE [Haliea sp.]
MPVHSLRMPRLALAAAACAVLAGCGSFDGATQRMASSMTPYKVEVVQGNFVSKEQVEAIKAGMSRQQVRDVLGTPLMTSVFHSDRWDYVFTLRRKGVDAQTRRLTVFFKGDVLERFEGDEMPTEADFVATLDARRKPGKVPVLELSEDRLKQLPLRSETAAEQPAAPSAAAATYPPLEPAAR